MTVKIDIERLKADMKQAAEWCSKAKRKAREAQRVLSAVQHQEKHSGEIPGERRRCVDEVNATRGEAHSASLAMTKLCVLRAHLRGREHLSSCSSLGAFVKEWIAELTPDYVSEEPAVDKPAA